MTFFLAVVACRANGETDITPIGAMGKVTRLFCGVTALATLTTNLMTASVTAGAASSAQNVSSYIIGTVSAAVIESSTHTGAGQSL